MVTQRRVLLKGQNKTKQKTKILKTRQRFEVSIHRRRVLCERDNIHNILKSDC